jgi:hypothetical protein
MREWMYSSTITDLDTALDGGEWLASRPDRFTPGETAPGTDCIGGRMGPTSGLDVVDKRSITCPCLKSNPDSSAVQHSA